MFEGFSIFLHWLQDPAFDLALGTLCMVIMKDALDAPIPQQPKQSEEENFQTQKSEDFD